MFTKSIFDALNQTEHLDAKSVLRSIRIVYFSLILGILSFLAVTFLITENSRFYFDKGDPIIFANLILFLTAIPVGFIVSQAMWKRIDAGLQLKNKLLKYQAGFLVRVATCEGAALFSIVGFLLSDNLVYLVLTAAALLVIYSYYPSAEKIESQLGLSQNDLDNLYTVNDKK